MQIVSIFWLVRWFLDTEQKNLFRYALFVNLSQSTIYTFIHVSSTAYVLIHLSTSVTLIYAINQLDIFITKSDEVFSLTGVTNIVQLGTDSDDYQALYRDELAEFEL